MAESPLPVRGDVVAGKYRIDSTIGQGGMGVVLGAFDQSLGRPVAIKFLHPSRAASEATTLRFGREARAAAAIKSEHVVRVYEVGQLPNGAPFIVMEHLHGSDLAQVVHSRGGLSVEQACDLVLQACEALAQAHALGIVHRDLKPQNLFLTQRPDGAPCVKVLDFGISKAADGDESSPKLTSTEMVMGTPLYMSPEQVRSLKNVDARADIWALGAILFELLAATPPFDGPSASALHASIAMDPPASLRERRPDVPTHIEAVVLRCLEKDPARRFQSVQELAAAIAPFARASASGLLGSIGSAPRVVSMPPPAGGFGGGASGVGVASAATGGFGAASTMDARSGGWQQATAPQAASATGAMAPTTAKSPSSSQVIVGVILAALVALLGLAGLGLFFLTRQAASTNVTPIASGSSNGAHAGDLPPPIVTDPETDGAKPAPSTLPAPGPVPHAVDAGSPANPSVKPAAKDAGAPKEDPEQATARVMEASCRHTTMRMQMAKTDAEIKREAEQARLTNCITRPAVRCQRQICRDACVALHDQACMARYQDLERGFPAKY